MTQFAHVGDPLLLGHILENLSQVVFRVWNEKRWELQGDCWNSEHCYTSSDRDFRVKYRPSSAAHSGVTLGERGTCFTYKQPFPSSESDKHGDLLTDGFRPLHVSSHALYVLNSGMLIASREHLKYYVDDSCCAMTSVAVMIHGVG